MIDLGPGICADDTESRRHEWLLTNGRGGYACGSIAGTLDRRYHAALAAAIVPPDTRCVVLAKFDERLIGAGKNGSDATLTSDVWEGNGLSGFGHRHLIRFRVLEGRTEATWLVGETRLTRRMVMPHGFDAIVVEYVVDHAPTPTQKPIELAIKLIGGNRAADFLAPDAGFTPPLVAQGEAMLRWKLPKTKHGGLATTLTARVTNGSITPASEWYRGYRLDTEASRGYDSIDSHLDLGEVRATLAKGDVLRITVTCGDDQTFDDPFGAEAARVHVNESDPPFVQALVRAADQFIVERPINDETNGSSIIAGYPWFADWGRDTMISLPGLCLATGRKDLAKEILKTFAAFVDRGMLPNRFPGRGMPPEYNTADAALLYIEAIGLTWRATKDDEFLRAILPAVDQVLDGYVQGTRHGIGMDPTDSLVHQGAPGLQLTWMDARIGDTVVTPRRGKAVEINALWHSAWCWRGEFAKALGDNPKASLDRAATIRASFSKFSNTAHDYLADVIDGEHGIDFSLRPNQLVATGCAHPPVTGNRAKAILAACTKALLIPTGLRTLAPDDSRYQAHYHGSQRSRDAAYHMGTAWPWLMGPFIRTHLRVHRDPAAAREILEPFIAELSRRGLGSISEVHDGDAPYTPGGCIAQAWSVAEVLSAWQETR